MDSKATTEIKIAKPYFTILSNINISNTLRRNIIKDAPIEFYSVLTQLVRHLINNSFCVQHTEYCSKYESALYLIALPATSIIDKQKILRQEPVEFISQLNTLLYNIL